MFTPQPCIICGEMIYDSTSCARCLPAFNKDMYENRARLQAKGMWPMKILEWGEFITNGNKLENGEITKEEFERRKQQTIAKVQERIRQCEERARQREAADRINHGQNAYK